MRQSWNIREKINLLKYIKERKINWLGHVLSWEPNNPLPYSECNRRESKMMLIIDDNKEKKKCLAYSEVEIHIQIIGLQPVTRQKTTFLYNHILYS